MLLSKIRAIRTGSIIPKSNGLRHRPNGLTPMWAICCNVLTDGWPSRRSAPFLFVFLSQKETMKQPCEHPNLRFSITGELVCPSCVGRWKDGVATRILLGRVEVLQQRIESLEEYYCDRINTALWHLGLDTCEECGEFFPKESNPYGIRIAVEGEPGCYAPICRNCLGKLCTAEDGHRRLNPESHQDQIAQWWAKHYGLDANNQTARNLSYLTRHSIAGFVTHWLEIQAQTVGEKSDRLSDNQA